MLNKIEFGERLKNLRKSKNYTQEYIAEKIGVSGQGVSKWEKGECLPDVFNLKLLSRLYRVTADSLLDEEDRSEKVVKTIKIGEAVFEIVEKPKTILAGKIFYETPTQDIERLIQAFDENQKQLTYNTITDPVLPICNIHLSINFWKHGSIRGMGFMRETATENQPQGVDVYIMPPAQFIRIYTSKAAANLLSKQECEIWELFAYIRNYFMPSHGYKMAENGAQELEVFDSSDHGTGYAYMPVTKI